MTYFEEKIHDAALNLDIVKPGWENEIDIDNLNMNECTECILGQLYGNAYNDDVRRRFNIIDWASSAFTWDTEAEWIAEINKRIQRKQFEDVVNAT